MCLCDVGVASCSSLTASISQSVFSFGILISFIMLLGLCELSWFELAELNWSELSWFYVHNSINLAKHVRNFDV